MPPIGLQLNIGANVTQGVAGLKQLNAELNRLQSQGKLSIAGLEGSIKNFQAGLKQATNPADITKFNLALMAFGDKTKELKTAGIDAGNGMAAGFNKAITPLRTLANIIPGLGISGLLSFAIGGLTQFARGLFKVRDAYNAAAAQADVLKKANAAIGDDVARLNALVAVAKDVSLSTQQRTNAIAELQKLYPDYLRNITLENINSSGAARALDALTRSLVSKAVAQAYSTKIAEESIKFDDLKTKLIALQSAQLKDQLGFLAQKTALEQRGSFLSKDIVKNQELGQARYNRELNETTNALQAQDAALTDLFSKTKLATAQSLDFVATPKLKNVKKDLNLLLKDFRWDVPLILTDRSLETTYKNLQTIALAKPLQIPVELDASKILAVDLEKLMKLDEIGEELNSLLSNFSADLFTAVGEGIGDALSGKGSLLTPILNVLGDLIQQIGKALIQYGIVKTGLDKILVAGLALPGAFALALGLAAVAAGQLVKSSAPRLAEGGIIPQGFPNDSFPALLSSGEAVIPLNKQLPGMGGHGMQKFEIVGKSRGSDILYALKRTERKQGRGF